MNHLSERAPAQSRARNLLAAWNSANLERLEAALDANLDSADFRLPAIEKERIELITEVVNVIRGWIGKSKNESELQAALLLLRHVGCQEPEYFAMERSHGSAFAGSRSI